MRSPKRVRDLIPQSARKPTRYRAAADELLRFLAENRDIAFEDDFTCAEEFERILSERFGRAALKAEGGSK